MAFASAFSSRWQGKEIPPCYSAFNATEYLIVQRFTMRGRLPHQGRIHRLRRKLSGRDLDVLRSLHKVRLLSLRQLQRLHVVDGALGARVRRAQQLLKRLHGLDLVVRLSRVIGGVRAGSAGFTYGLSGLGQAVLQVDGPLGRRRRRVWETKPYFQDHMLAVAEFYVQLVEHEREGCADLLQFDGEPACWRRHHGPGGEMSILKPDAYVRLGIGDIERSAFVEVDLATESLPTIRRKCQCFIAYWRSGIEQRHRSVFPKVVWLVPDERRQENVASVVLTLPTGSQVLFDVGLLKLGPKVLSGQDSGEAT
ncbi:replication-relaxation family protein [Allokutzneria sp. A3M-2-11 16]|uniref:replication-relaxation family protein n=1 Tax=Allokutzneria sp. A3M-2-11 16 TaxID=2962043 RepID=UPI0020B89AE6|nr:replication-relaxation family protein [Allokutzneria sp. A3M-2-11 16]MCP3797956.1 replication-relaxation family protein [Allokutzneria sp. A3M-2-11 16]